MSAATVDHVLGAYSETKERTGVDFAIGNGNNLHRGGQRLRDARARAGEIVGTEEVALVEHDEIGACDLILENFLDWIVVFKRRVGGALPRERGKIGSDATGCHRGAVNHRHYAIYRDAALDRRPMKRLHQRLGQSETGGLDHNVLNRWAAGKNHIERRHELIRDGAAQTPIGKLDNVLLRTGGIATALEYLTVDADIAELIDNDGETAALRVREDMANQRGLPGAEKAGHDGTRHARKGLDHAQSSGGTPPGS